MQNHAGSTLTEISPCSKDGPRGNNASNAPAGAGTPTKYREDFLLLLSSSNPSSSKTESFLLLVFDSFD